MKDKTVINENGCWVWTGYVTAKGYGQIRLPEKTVRVHRYSYTHYKGSIDEDIMVCHSCDNPSCWNPEHLFLGTAQDNTDDMMRKNRNGFVKHDGEQNGNSKLTESDIRLIRSDSRKLVDIADDFGVHFTTISDIKRKKIWRHVE